MTFSEWQLSAVPSYQVEYARGFRQRSCYDMLGQHVFLETSLPQNWFFPSTCRMVAAGFTIRADSETMSLAARFGGEWEPGYYMEVGFGWPIFRGADCAEKCWHFLESWLKR